MSKNIKYILGCCITGVILFVVIAPYLADATTIVITNPFEQNSIEGLIQTIVNDILMPIGGVIAVLMIMYAGFLYVTARGNPAQITKAHDAMKWAVIGAAILLGAWVISQAISATINQLKK